MGGGYYRGDVEERTRSSSRRDFDRESEKRVVERKCHESLVPFQTTRECRDNPDHPHSTPIVVIMDVTRSRGKDVKVIYEKLPMLFGQICMKEYVPDPTISFAAVGDFTAGDLAPVQIGQFEADNRLDQVLKQIWREEGGGGTGQESYELAAYYYARHAVMDSLEIRGEKGYLFFQGDEGFYPMVSKEAVKKLFGDKIEADIPSAKIFRELQEKFHVYFILPNKSWEERKKDVDEEIKQRVLKAGGLIEGVDIRFSLMWNNKNDLDLHCITPSGFHIFFSEKKGDGGYLDVDMNANEPYTTKPVENIRWKKGQGKQGSYRVFVRNYAFHERDYSETPFTVEIEINGEIQHFKGKAKAGSSGSDSDVEVGVFTFDPEARPDEVPDDRRYEGYDQDKIRAQWASVIPAENIIEIEDPRGTIDAQLGVLAIVHSHKSLDAYVLDMEEKGQDAKRIADVRKALTPLAEAASGTAVDVQRGKAGRSTKKRSGGAKRL